MMKMLSSPVCIFVLSSLFSLCIFQTIPSIETCTGRKILKDGTGLISDGTGNYTQYSRCEWLIDAGSSKKFIHLEFLDMETECSYDFVMVYDGNSYNSTLLATASGNTKPKPIVAKSGYMLIYLFSDRNYNLRGFTANYSIQDCPFMCHNHGKCVDHTCICKLGYTGESCESEICPDICKLHGRCIDDGCSCNENFIGESCNFNVGEYEKNNHWYFLSQSSQNFTARLGHSASYVKSLNCIYIFGGYDLNRILDDLVIYYINSSTWEIAIKSDLWPVGRKNHAAASADDGFYIFGGSLVNGSYANDLWFYNVSLQSWTLKAINSSIQPEKMMDHTLTFAKDMLYVIGGKTDKGLYSSDIYRINVTECDTWEKVEVSGDSRHSRMLAGHTAVFHDVADSILVYGGYQSLYSLYVELSGKIYAFSLSYLLWSELYNTQIEQPRYEKIRNHIPDKRAHHTSLIIGNYMVVHGGNIHIHQDIETCYDNGTYLYHLGCHQWMKHPLLVDIQTNAERRFGHVAVKAFGNTMFVIGGYSGRVLGDVSALKFFPTVSPYESAIEQGKDYCRSHTDHGGSGVHSCMDDIECALCDFRKDTTRGGCVHRESAVEMCNKSKAVRVTPCPGICSTLTSCEACLSLGQGLSLTRDSPKGRVYQEECSWCVKSATCQNRWYPEDVCDDTSTEGWWEGTSPSWTSIDQCTNNDLRAGIQIIYYYPPQNLLQPDQVLYLKSTSIKVEDVLPFHGNFDKMGKQLIARITGYIHPLDAPLIEGTDTLLLYLKGSGDITATLNLSNDSSVKNQEIVIPKKNYKHESSSEKAQRNNKEPMFPYVSKGYKYYMAIEVGKYLRKDETSVTLEWNVEVDRDDGQKSLNLITFEYLEPYNSVHCTIHSNCLACMTDASCAWCPSSSACFYKGDNSSKCDGIYPITQPSQCDMCHNYPDCRSCVTDMLCEWSPDENKCIRRGRYMLTNRNASECSIPCHKRESCSMCVDNLKDECFWCENTKECFPFAHYISQHISGQCQEWVDKDDIEKKQTCRACSNYKSCDSCLSRYGCGWCGNVDNRMIGRCVDGDFSGPSYNQNCSVIVAFEGRDKNITIDDPAAWMYDKCLDLDECAHGVDDCDENSSCENTETSYICKCKRGYIQIGKVCNKTCYHHCVHGKCSANYECTCDLGFTGPDCSVDCQCNYQSTCTKDVGICDDCINNTGGSHCQFCLPGYYSNATKGCLPCQCNDHGDISRGHCNNVTGNCYCTDNTVGLHCETCQSGYYGDPSNGGKCYRNCDNRVILTQTSGSLGSFQGSGVTSSQINCLWIINRENKERDMTNDDAYDTSTVTFTIDSISTVCGREHVYIYEDIPDFVYGQTNTKSGDSGQLASFCGTKSPVYVTAQSRTITVIFQADIGTPGFNASYQVNSCKESCSFSKNRVCRGQQCVCEAGFNGDDCQYEICTDGCLYIKEQHSCRCETSLGPVEIFPWNSVFPHHTSAPEPRYGHTLVSCGSDSLYMFGGYSLQYGLQKDVWKFDLNTSVWSLIVSVTTTEPTGRYFHAAVCLPYLQNIYMFGGLVNKGQGLYKATNEMWKFGIGTRKWTKEISTKDVHVIGVAAHTMTKISDTKLLVIGGITTDISFSELMYEYDAASSSWKAYDHHTDLIGSPIGLYGHTAVYNERTETVYIYGGMLKEHHEFENSDELFAFDLNDKQWNNLKSTQGSQKDKRLFHTAVDIGEYMVIFGGHLEGQADEVLVYHYQCNFWNQFKFIDMHTRMPFEVMSSSASVAIDTTVYITGGYDGKTYSKVIKLTLPRDRCDLIKDISCKNTSGCKASIVPDSDEKNITSCFSSSGPYPEDALQIVGGPQCDEQWHDTRRFICDQYKDCASCLAVYPQFNKSRLSCQWCSNCKRSRCVKYGEVCPGHDDCIPGDIATKFRVEHCPDFTCRAGTCHRCSKLGICAWSKPFHKLIENGGSRTEKSGWSCINKLRFDNNSQSITCPDSCQSAADCFSCFLKSASEYGSLMCTWSQTLQTCMSPISKSLQCANGNCGLLIHSSEWRCPKQCHEHLKCFECLKAPGCGWCSYGGQNGLGLCITGGIRGPTRGSCKVGDVSSREKDAPMNHWFSTLEPTWSYVNCPPENECMNDHHDCNLRTQTCIDTLEGFNCSCKKGYREDLGERQCYPICQQGCVHGTCVLPDVCQCHFGYIGSNCTVECQCNKHSNCESVEKRKNCLECRNNTQGPQCEHCKLWYVGNPRNDQPCVSCFTVCHNHTTRCSTVKDFTKLDQSVIETTYDYDKVIPDFNPNGPTGTPVCIRCQNNTEGRLCDVCKNGYFRLRSDGSTAYDACIKCQCHGHSNTCDNTTGKCHYCANNTATRCNDENGSDNCWQKQCSTCKEYFQGNPVNNHQCYRQMMLEREYCLDPTTQNDCNQNPSPLMQGRTVFYTVHPRYLNVDIRITIDVFKGGADVFFSSNENTFIVKLNKNNGVHVLELDNDLKFKSGSAQKWSYPMNKRSLDNYNIHFHNRMLDLADEPRKDKISVENTTSGVVYELVEIEAENFHTYHTVMKTKTILRVKNVESRLVITIPVHSHNLRVSKFYIIMYGVGGKNSNHTYGNLYFRQDQPHIDLFVFFSVFFSSFFLFLAVCVLLWKIKQAVDTQRSRQQRAKEMMHMASRPFSKVLVYIEPEPILMSSTPILRRQKLPKIPHRNVPIMGLTPVDALPPIIHSTFTIKEVVPFDVIPIAVEPLTSGSAAIRTVAIQLPGGPNVTSKLCLGSSLTTNYRATSNNPKTNTRRRPSTTAC